MNELHMAPPFNFPTPICSLRGLFVGGSARESTNNSWSTESWKELWHRLSSSWLFSFSPTVGKRMEHSFIKKKRGGGIITSNFL